MQRATDRTSPHIPYEACELPVISGARTGEEPVPRQQLLCPLHSATLGLPNSWPVSEFAPDPPEPIIYPDNWEGPRRASSPHHGYMTGGDNRLRNHPGHTARHDRRLGATTNIANVSTP